MTNPLWPVLFVHSKLHLAPPYRVAGAGATLRGLCPFLHRWCNSSRNPLKSLCTCAVQVAVQAGPAGYIRWDTAGATRGASSAVAGVSPFMRDISENPRGKSAAWPSIWPARLPCPRKWCNCDLFATSVTLRALPDRAVVLPRGQEVASARRRRRGHPARHDRTPSASPPPLHDRRLRLIVHPHRN
jgi:hypothetical protein